MADKFSCPQRLSGAPETVSVIIPTWNRAYCLQNAVRSALAQTHPVQEVLVCDDGSSDESRSLIAGINDPRVKWIPGPHTGLSAVARNRGAALATAEWFAFLDSDDEWFPNKLSVQFEVIRQTGALFTCSAAVGAYDCHCESTEGIDPTPVEFTFEMLLHRNFVVVSSSLMHRSVFLKAHGFSEGRKTCTWQDYDLWLRISAFTKIIHCPIPLLRYAHDSPDSVRTRPDYSVRAKRREFQRNFARWAKTNDINKEKRRLVAKQLWPHIPSLPVAAWRKIKKVRRFW